MNNNNMNTKNFYLVALSVGWIISALYLLEIADTVAVLHHKIEKIMERDSNE